MRWKSRRAYGWKLSTNKWLDVAWLRPLAVPLQAWRRPLSPPPPLLVVIQFEVIAIAASRKRFAAALRTHLSLAKNRRPLPFTTLKFCLASPRVTLIRPFARWRTSASGLTRITRKFYWNTRRSRLPTRLILTAPTRIRLKLIGLFPTSFVRPKRHMLAPNYPWSLKDRCPTVIPFWSRVAFTPVIFRARVRPLITRRLTLRSPWTKVTPLRSFAMRIADRQPLPSTLAKARNSLIGNALLRSPFVHWASRAKRGPDLDPLPLARRHSRPKV